jgi:hypothetical protein
MRMNSPAHGSATVKPEEFGHEMARHLAAKAAAALAMAGQSYRLEVRPDDAFQELIQILRPWVEKNVDGPIEAGSGETPPPHGQDAPGRR